MYINFVSSNTHQEQNISGAVFLLNSDLHYIKFRRFDRNPFAIKKLRGSLYDYQIAATFFLISTPIIFNT